MDYSNLPVEPKKPSWLRICFSQLGLLLWKNYKLQTRSIFMTILEILVPTLFAIILLPIRGIVKSIVYSNNTLYKPFEVNQLPANLSPYNSISFSEFKYSQGRTGANMWSFGYQPSNSLVVNTTMNMVAQNLGLNLYPFDNETAMVSYITDPVNSQFFLGGASFLNDKAENFTYKLRFSYSPRNSGENGQFKQDQDWKTQFLFFLFPILGPREKNQNDGGDPGYAREGFLAVQKAIDFSFISQFNSSISNIDVYLKRFAYPAYNDDKFVAIIAGFLPFVLVLSFVFTVILTAKAIVYEKETGLKEAMKLMGMKPWVYWLSWYLKTFMLLLPSLIFMIIAYKIKITLKDGSKASIIDKTDPGLFALFLFLYASSTITFTFLCTTFFKKANNAAAGAGVIWFFSYLPFIFISLRFQKMNFVEKILACFVNNLGMAEGMLMIGQFEGKGTGVTFTNWTEGLNVGDDFTMFQVMIILFINNFIHILLTYYFENVIPSDFGMTKPWYFPIAWLLPKKVVHADTSLKVQRAESEEVYLEDESIYASRNIGVKINGIGKMYKQLGKIKNAVKKLSLNIYEGQISVLLGHNGAGKSTTISMITGLVTPTKGEILIKGKDVNKETDEARSVLGYCPQHNLLFNDLTVQEHLEFFSKLKRNFDQTEIDDMLKLINLSDKKKAQSKTLSGGMKRKLSVAIAFIGGSKIVILDEPSSGMDPQARHATWSLLQKFKKERDCTILLTTHFMDEADFLGDRIAIMSKGELKCCGSPLYLKSKYGSGYNLIITRQRDESAKEGKIQDQDLVNRISDVVLRTVPNSAMSSNVNTELSYVLPTTEANRFPDLFEQLDKRMDEFRILNIGISITTLEEVFLKINETEYDEELNINESNINNGQDNPVFSNENIKINPLEGSNDSTLGVNTFQADIEEEDYGLWVGSRKNDLVSDVQLWAQQFQALIIKRVINSIRNKGLIISQLIIPMAILLINLLYVKYGPIKAEDSPARIIDLEQYSSNYVPVNLIGVQSVKENLASDLMNSFESVIEKISTSQSFYLTDNSTITSCTGNRTSLDNFLGCIGNDNLQNYLDEYQIAGEFQELNNNKAGIIGYFSNQPYHTSPLALNLISNTLLRYFTNKQSHKITVINHPLPRNLKDQVQDLMTKGQTGYQVGSGLTFGYSFLVASFVIFLIKERTSDAKHLQYMSGCNSNIFWSSAFIWDLMNYLIPSSIVIILLAVFNIEAYVTNGRFLLSFLLLVIYGMAHIPQMYLMSYLFKVPSTGYASLAAWNILSSQGSLLPVTILAVPALGLLGTAKGLEWLFMIIFPNFALGQAFIDMYTNDAYRGICDEFQNFCDFQPNQCCLYKNKSNPNRCGPNGVDDCLLWTNDTMSWAKPGVGRELLFMALQFIITFTIVLLYEGGILRKLNYMLNNALKLNPSHNLNSDAEENTEEAYNDIPKDVDVLNEEERISEILKRSRNYEEIFIVDKLTKYYSQFMAVKGVSFSMKKAQCFGLLGVNGAGKTSTFKMITGDTFITKGEAFLNKTSLKLNTKNFQSQLGYCPQFDPLIDQMKVIETMYMYARIRGIRKHLIHRTCQSLIKLLDLTDHAEKMCYTLSGGNKRKLSVAISLIGSPIVVLLDEPTSGMDPKTRRTLWDTLNKIRNKGKSLILTTHGMDETEALCTNIGIMVNGELKCLGSLQHLKGKYGEGYTLLVKIPLTDDNTVKIQKFITFILSSFSNAKLKESRDGFINIHINNNKSSELANIFKLIEQVKEEYSIEYYVVTQTKLEQIFLNFASKQIDPESRILKKKGCLSFC